MRLLAISTSLCVDGRWPSHCLRIIHVSCFLEINVRTFNSIFFSLNKNEVLASVLQPVRGRWFITFGEGATELSWNFGKGLAIWNSAQFPLLKETNNRRFLVEFKLYARNNIIKYFLTLQAVLKNRQPLMKNTPSHSIDESVSSGYPKAPGYERMQISVSRLHRSAFVWFRSQCRPLLGGIWVKVAAAYAGRYI